MSAPPTFQEANECFYCSAKFGFLKRRHHCRNCGRSCCDKCSPSSAKLPKYGINTPVRVCNSCVQSLREENSQPKARPAPSQPRERPSVPQKRSSEPAQTQSSSSGTGISRPTKPAMAPARLKKVTKCTCNMPFCVCKADPVIAKKKKKPAKKKPPAQKSKTSDSSSTSKQESKKTARKKPSSSSSSSFFGLGSQSQRVSVNLSGDLEVQAREACKSGDADALEALLNAGADPSYVDQTHNSLVHIAAIFNHTKSVLMLMKAGADPWLQNADGDTAVRLAPPALQLKMKELHLELKGDKKQSE